MHLFQPSEIIGSYNVNTADKQAEVFSNSHSHLLHFIRYFIEAL